MDRIIRSLNETGKYNIAFVGDSLTSCEWVHPNWREIIEYVLKEELQKEFGENWRIPSWGIRCFNFGFDGSTTKDIVNKIDEILKVEPDLVITMIGSNDPTLKVSIEEHGENMQIISERLGGILAPDFRPNDKKLAEIYEPYINKDIEANLKGFINLFDLFRPEDKMFTFKTGFLNDNWHPNQLGNAYIAQIFLENIFGINFDPEKYIETNLKGYKYPEY